MVSIFQLYCCFFFNNKTVLMRKTLFITIAILIFGCTKEINSGSVNTGSISNIQNVSATDTYLPLKKGTFWTYNIQTDAEKPETSTLKVLDLQKKINDKNYKAVKSTMGKKKDTLYYAQDQHDYYLYTYSGTSDGDNVNMELLFLKDNASVGESWLLPAGTANGFNLKCYGKIIEKDATITVGDVTYDHVIHSYVEIRKPLFFTYIVVNRQDFYTAKNIGIIKNVSDILLPDKTSTTTKITGYKIK
jgi:hypothetical protein